MIKVSVVPSVITVTMTTLTSWNIPVVTCDFSEGAKSKADVEEHFDWFEQL